jgi:hypothetical protein
MKGLAVRRNAAENRRAPYPSPLPAMRGEEESLNFKIEHQRAERLAVSVEREQARHAAAKRVLKHEIERADIRHFVSRDRSGRDASKMRGDPRGGQRTAAPALCDVTEETMLDLVPFRRPWRIMADVERQPRFVGQRLQFDFPQPNPRPVRASAIVSAAASG